MAILNDLIYVTDDCLQDRFCFAAICIKALGALLFSTDLRSLAITRDARHKLPSLGPAALPAAALKVFR